MKKLTLLISLCIFTLLKGYAQKTPVLNIGKEQLALAKLDVKTKIVGTIATTTYDMSFYNATNRVLEGQLKFPLAENQEIVRLALEINGKLREGVVVEKELGRIAFEGIVRRGVDPALLEKGKGNTYNVRVYPIPAKGYKRVVIAYEQELLYKDNAHFYHLPLHFKERLENFNINIEVVNQHKKPLLVKGEEIMQFSNWQNSYKTTFSKEKYTPNKSILVKIPIDVKGEKLIASPNYFYFYKTLNTSVKKRKKPKSISLVWDVSLSMKSRNIEKEIDLLNKYFKTTQNSIVYFIPFSNKVLGKEKFIIKNENWDELKEKLLKSVYDGGTSFSAIQDFKIKSDIVLLSSDGMTTLSNTKLFKENPVFIINSKTEANHKQLNSIAKKTKGTYINLNRSSTKEALTSLTTVPFKYLGFSSKRKNIEVYPSFSSKGLLDFSVAGKNYTNGEKITFFFGYGNTITKEIPVIIKANTQTKDDEIKRIWAKNKLNELTEKPKENKKQIIELATEYGLVTDYTSLIVLEEVEDYVRYNITPPKELLEEYNRIKNNTLTKKRIATNNINSSLPPPPPAPERIEIVEDDAVLEEVVMLSTESDEEESKSSGNKKYKGSLEVANRTPKTPYLTALSFFKDKESAYLFYLTQRESYKELPHYYIDVSDYFLQKFKAKKYADRILSNIAELDADNYELLKAYAYKLQERSENNLALFIYKKILELRPEDAQSYRDLALAYQEVELCQEAFDVFLDIVTEKIYKDNKHRRVFQGLQDIAKEELQQLYLKYKDDLDKTKIPKELLSEIQPIDLRIVVDWNHNDTDIDLHIIDPNLEECYYEHTITTQGGTLSKDMTQGFGPESFTLKKAKKGWYYVKIKYFGDRKQKIETPTFMKITIFKNQGKRNEEKIVQVIRLTKSDEEEIVQKIKI